MRSPPMTHRPARVPDPQNRPRIPLDAVDVVGFGVVGRCEPPDLRSRDPDQALREVRQPERAVGIGDDPPPGHGRGIRIGHETIVAHHFETVIVDEADPPGRVHGHGPGRPHAFSLPVPADGAVPGDPAEAEARGGHPDRAVPARAELLDPRFRGSEAFAAPGGGEGPGREFPAVEKGQAGAVAENESARRGLDDRRHFVFQEAVHRLVIGEPEAHDLADAAQSRNPDVALSIAEETRSPFGDETRRGAQAPDETFGLGVVKQALGIPVNEAAPAVGGPEKKRKDRSGGRRRVGDGSRQSFRPPKRKITGAEEPEPVSIGRPVRDEAQQRRAPAVRSPGQRRRLSLLEADQPGARRHKEAAMIGGEAGDGRAGPFFRNRRGSPALPVEDQEPAGESPDGDPDFPARPRNREHRGPARFRRERGKRQEAPAPVIETGDRSPRRPGQGPNRSALVDGDMRIDVPRQSLRRAEQPPRPAVVSGDPGAGGEPQEPVGGLREVVHHGARQAVVLGVGMNEVALSPGRRRGHDGQEEDRESAAAAHGVPLQGPGPRACDRTSRRSISSNGLDKRNEPGTAAASRTSGPSV